MQNPFSLLSPVPRFMYFSSLSRGDAQPAAKRTNDKVEKSIISDRNLCNIATQPRVHAVFHKQYWFASHQLWWKSTRTGPKRNANIQRNRDYPRFVGSWPPVPNAQTSI